MIEDHGEDFDEHNVATAFQELAKEKANVGNEDVHAHETFLKLVGECRMFHYFRNSCKTPKFVNEQELLYNDVLQWYFLYSLSFRLYDIEFYVGTTIQTKLPQPGWPALNTEV